jgi:hypothetical protein
MSVCVMADCEKPTVGRGYCRAHYGQFRRGTLFKPQIPVTLNDAGVRICNYEGCGRPHKCLGKCSKHYFSEYHQTVATTYKVLSLPKVQATEDEAREAHMEEYWQWVKKELKIA